MQINQQKSTERTDSPSTRVTLPGSSGDVRPSLRRASCCHRHTQEPGWVVFTTIVPTICGNTFDREHKEQERGLEERNYDSDTKLGGRVAFRKRGRQSRLSWHSGDSICKRLQKCQYNKLQKIKKIIKNNLMCQIANKY